MIIGIPRNDYPYPRETSSLLPARDKTSFQRAYLGNARMSQTTSKLANNMSQQLVKLERLKYAGFSLPGIANPFSVYQIATSPDLSGQGLLAIQVRYGMLSMRGRSIISLESIGLFSGNFEQLVFFDGTNDTVVGWNDEPTPNSYAWMTLTTSPQDTDVLYDYGSPGQIILNPDAWGGQMIVVLWLVVTPDGFGAELHMSNVTGNFFPVPSPQIIPLAYIIVFGAQPPGSTQTPYSVYTNQIFSGGAGISRFSPMIGFSADGSTVDSAEPSGPTYYAGDFEDDNMSDGWVIWPGDIVRVTEPYVTGPSAYKAIGTVTIPGTGNTPVYADVNYAFFQCISPNQILITDNPCSGDWKNPIVDPTSWIMVSEIYKDPNPV